MFKQTSSRYTDLEYFTILGYNLAINWRFAQYAGSEMLQAGKFKALV